MESLASALSEPAANLQLLAELDIPHKLCKHEDYPVTTYEQAAEVRSRFGLTGVESKSLFLRVKRKGRGKAEAPQYCMYLTVQGNKADFKKIKQVLGVASVAVPAPEELTRVTGCTPGCAGPFGLPQQVAIVADACFKGIGDVEETREEDKRFIYSPGVTTMTIEIAYSDVARILAHVKNRVVFL